MSESQSFGRWWQLNYHYVALLMLLLGTLMLIIGGLGAWFSGKAAPDGLGFVSKLEGWSYWLVLVGVFAALAGGYYVYHHLSLIKEFEEVMENKGRANFIKNLDRVEELAYRLGTPFERRVVDRKNEYRLK